MVYQYLRSSAIDIMHVGQKSATCFAAEAVTTMKSDKRPYEGPQALGQLR